MDKIQFHNDLRKLINILPPETVNSLKPYNLDDAVEIVLDLGREAEIRYTGGKIDYLQDCIVQASDIEYITSRIQPFTNDNRSGIAGTLHRISAIRNRQGKVVGLTCRIGRIVTGTINCIKDIVLQNKSILFLGRPGVGKTTKLREISRLAADELKKRVVVVDTSNEIAGDGDIPHPAIGRARRMQVMQPAFQKDVMIEAVENHTPEVIVVDEIGTEEEAQAARTIAERGVMLIATAHGNSLDNLIKNPSLSDLIGGVSSVTLGDDEAKRRGSQKTVLEREKQPAFDVVIEIIDRNTLAVYKNTAEAVDCILRGWPVRPEIRKVDETYSKDINIEKPQQGKSLNTSAPAGFTVNFSENFIENPEEEKLKFSFSRREYVKQARGYKKLYIYAVSRAVVDKTLERLNLKAEITRNIEDADAVIVHKAFAKGGSKILSAASDYRLPVYYVRSNAMPQVQKALKEALHITQDDNQPLFEDETETALDEAKDAAQQVINGLESAELKPRSAHIRKLQHELADSFGLSSISIGDGAERHLKITKKI